MYPHYYKILGLKYEFKLSKLIRGDIFQNAFFSHINVNIRWSNLKGEWGEKQMNTYIIIFFGGGGGVILYMGFCARTWKLNRCLQINKRFKKNDI